MVNLTAAQDSNPRPVMSGKPHSSLQLDILPLKGGSMTRYLFVENTCFSAPFYVYAITRLDDSFATQISVPCLVHCSPWLPCLLSPIPGYANNPSHIDRLHPKTTYSHHLPFPRLPLPSPLSLTTLSAARDQTRVPY